MTLEVEHTFAYNISMGKRVWDWAAIQRFHDEGHGFVECRRKFGFSHTAWVKAIAAGKLTARPRPWAGRRPEGFAPADRRRIYDWALIQAYYDEGYSSRECQAKFGFNAMSWHKARLRGEIRTRPAGMPLDELLSSGGSRYNVKIRLLRCGLLINACARCGLTHWQGERLSLHLDHINGVRNDHRLENLRLLCPNCHSLTETYGGRNKKRHRGLQDQGGTV